MRYLATFACCAALFLTACEPAPDPSDLDVEEEAGAALDEETFEAQTARVFLDPLADSGVSGAVVFTTLEEGGVRIDADVEGLEPGLHGFHVHEFGDCGPGEDGTPGGAAGSHYTPDEDPHGRPSDPPAERHLGDFGNLEASEEGVASYERVDDLIALEGPNSIVGKAVIVHADADEFVQPTGSAGSRVACGVIERAGGDYDTDSMLPGGMPDGDEAPGALTDETEHESGEMVYEEEQ